MNLISKAFSYPEITTPVLKLCKEYNDHREQDARRDRKECTVKSVDHTAVAREDGTIILDTNPSLDERSEPVSELRHDRHDKAQEE